MSNNKTAPLRIENEMVEHVFNGVTGLLLQHPGLRDALKRPIPCEVSAHLHYDLQLTEAALRAQWDAEQILQLIQDTYTANYLGTRGTDYCGMLMQEAQLRLTQGPAAQTLDRDLLCNHLSEMWHIPILAVIRHGDENTTWSLRLDDAREILLGTSKQLQDQTHVRAAIFDRTGKMIPRIPPKQIAEWDHLLEILSLIALHVANPEMTRLGQIRDVLQGYFDQLPYKLTQDFDTDEWEHLALSKRPFRKDGAIYVHARHCWLNHVRLVLPEWKVADVLDGLRLLKAAYVKVICNTEKTSRSYWRLPASWDESQDEQAYGNKVEKVGESRKESSDFSTSLLG
jgi:hypothetical protein